MLQAAWRQYGGATGGVSNAAVQLNFVDEKTIRQLHKIYFNDSEATDVITFPLVGPGLFGEIYVCLEVAQAQAQRYAVPLDTELARLALHGVLHLLGFDDHRPAARRRMRTLERRFLAEYFPE
jgi:probable rRNA maturation factor